MAAALARRKSGARRSDGPHPTNLTRDLSQIADLIELCFAQRLDSNGRAAIREMRVVSHLGPLLWLLALLEWSGLALSSGYVWRENQRVIGNVSTYRAGQRPGLGPGWLIANVAVHPDWRRRGIARALMEAALHAVWRQGGRWAALEVERDNEGAQALYRSLGFDEMETLAHWEVRDARRLLDSRPDLQWPVRLRRPDEWRAEQDLILERSRRGGITWTRPIERHDVLDSPWQAFNGLLEGLRRDHWVLDDPDQPGRLLGSLWVQGSAWRDWRLSLFLDPALTDPNGRLALLCHALSTLDPPPRTLRLETVADDPPLDATLQAAGFRVTRTLVQMWRAL